MVISIFNIPDITNSKPANLCVFFQFSLLFNVQGNRIHIV